MIIGVTDPNGMYKRNNKGCHSCGSQGLLVQVIWRAQGF